MQNFFLKEDLITFVKSGLVILPKIKNLINLFRKIERPVILLNISIILLFVI
ncbi:MAG: hypothetical protein NZ608_04410 [candidate division WOR-3 bacterium]|nr:hypothetical protein [candidate division WOR-3 bacterium]